MAAYECTRLDDVDNDGEVGGDILLKLLLVLLLDCIDKLDSEWVRRGNWDCWGTYSFGD